MHYLELKMCFNRGSFTLAVILSIGLLTNHNTLAATSLETHKPDWTKSNYRAESGLDFIGLSQLWVPGIAQAESKSIAEACTNGLGKVSEFFSVEIASKSTSSQVVVNDEFQGQFSVKTDKLSRINLTGISVSASYSEWVQEGQYIQSYCLYRLNRSQVNDVKRQLAKEQAEVKSLVTTFAQQLNKQHLAQARITLALLKSKKNVSNELVLELNRLIEEFAKGAIDVDMIFSQASYANNDILSLQLQANQNVFLYLFVEEGRYTSMILPSPAYGFNLVKQEETVKVPSRQQRQKGNIFKVSQSSELNQTSNVYLIASKNRLTTSFVKPAFNRFLVSDHEAFNDFLASCQLKVDCIAKTYPLLVSHVQTNYTISQYDIVVNEEIRDDLASSLKTNLIDQGFIFEAKGVDLEVRIKHTKMFSKKLDSDMFVAELRVRRNIGDRNKGVFKMRFSNLYDPNRTQSYLESMLKSASKKLMIKAKNGEFTQ